MPYDNRSLNNFVQKQGGSLQNLGASPTYTGAPAARGTPPGPQNQQPYLQQNPSFQRPGMPGQMPQGMPQGQGMMPQGSLQRLGMPMQPGMQPGMRPGMPMRPGMAPNMQPGMQPGQQPGRLQMNPQQQQRLAMIQQRVNDRSRLPQAGAPQMMGQRRGY